MDLPSIDEVVSKGAGFFGTLLALILNKVTSIPQGIITVIGGYAMSIYFGGWLERHTGLPRDGCGFLIGSFGVAICTAIMDKIKTGDLWNRVLIRMGI